MRIGARTVPATTPRKTYSARGANMLSVGGKFPEFSLQATVSTNLDKAFPQVDNNTYAGKWLCVFFYPKDFTFVCPTEIAGFAAANQAFADRDCQILTGSTDSE